MFWSQTTPRPIVHNYGTHPHVLAQCSLKEGRKIRPNPIFHLAELEWQKSPTIFYQSHGSHSTRLVIQPTLGPSWRHNLIVVGSPLIQLRMLGNPIVSMNWAGGASDVPCGEIASMGKSFQKKKISTNSASKPQHCFCSILWRNIFHLSEQSLLPNWAEVLRGYDAGIWHNGSVPVSCPSSSLHALGNYWQPLSDSYADQVRWAMPVSSFRAALSGSRNADCYCWC